MIKLSALAACLLVLLSPAIESLGMDSTKAIVSAAQVNGTWKNSRNEFKILALGKKSLKVAFYGTHEYRTAGGPGEITGGVRGVGTIDGAFPALKVTCEAGGWTTTISLHERKQS